MRLRPIPAPALSVHRVEVAVVLALCGINATAFAAELSEISNFREYSPSFSSSGQPTQEQIALLESEGFERIIYIAFSDSGEAFANEDVIVKEENSQCQECIEVHADYLRDKRKDDILTGDA